MPLLTITVDTGSGGETAAQLAGKTVQQIGKAPGAANAMGAKILAQFFKRIAGGLQNGAVVVSADAGAGAKASGTIQCVFASADVGDTVTVAGEVFTSVAANASVGPNQFSIGTTNATLAANLLTALNASAIASGLLTFSLATATITATARRPGLDGNGVTLATSDVDGFVLSAATLENGTANAGNSLSTAFQVG